MHFDCSVTVYNKEEAIWSNNAFVVLSPRLIQDRCQESILMAMNSVMSKNHSNFVSSPRDGVSVSPSLVKSVVASNVLLGVDSKYDRTKLGQV